MYVYRCLNFQYFLVKNWENIKCYRKYCTFLKFFNQLHSRVLFTLTMKAAYFNCYITFYHQSNNISKIKNRYKKKLFHSTSLQTAVSSKIYFYLSEQPSLHITPLPLMLPPYDHLDWLLFFPSNFRPTFFDAFWRGFYYNLTVALGR